MENEGKIVDFHKYCETCKHFETKEWEEPCNECLENPTNKYTTRPVCYKEDEKKGNKDKKENGQ